MPVVVYSEKESVIVHKKVKIHSATVTDPVRWSIFPHQSSQHCDKTTEIYVPSSPNVLTDSKSREKEEIAFTAKLNSHITTSSAIKFQAVITNIGGGYNSSDGVFYCPKAGLYLFSVTLMAYLSNYVDGRIMKNDKEILWIHENIKITYYPSASVTALIKLAVGDKVWVKGGGINYYSNANSFAGIYIN
ncbi:hypothetical protein KUTeg_006191 [Tegillarca granosa]|uniref:C1q domain-containing protein n=1 Tax=Tegillarca granosa TaxID=220873 RepID=A0ABQ9FFR7_TEGGR|nr:hypothetical protein KUTeg_006191 [Tegillarca granosa]